MHRNEVLQYRGLSAFLLSGGQAPVICYCNKLNICCLLWFAWAIMDSPT